MFLRVRDILRCTANYRIQKETHPESRVAPHLPAFVVMPSLPQAEMLDVSVFSQEPAEDGMPPPSSCCLVFFRLLAVAMGHLVRFKYRGFGFASWLLPAGHQTPASVCTCTDDDDDDDDLSVCLPSDEPDYSVSVLSPEELRLPAVPTPPSSSDLDLPSTTGSESAPPVAPSTTTATSTPTKTTTPTKAQAAVARMRSPVAPLIHALTVPPTDGTTFPHPLGGAAATATNPQLLSSVPRPPPRPAPIAVLAGGLPRRPRPSGTGSSGSGGAPTIGNVPLAYHKPRATFEALCYSLFGKNLTQGRKTLAIFLDGGRLMLHGVFTGMV